MVSARENSFQFTGLTDTNKRVVFNKESLIHESWKSYNNINNSPTVKAKIGDFVKVKIVDASQNALFAEPLCISSISEFSESIKV